MKGKGRDVTPEEQVYAGLNDAQKTAVQAMQGQVMILAGAGAGKTKTFIHRTANLIRTGTDPRNILCVTFTNRAARELRERLGKMVGAAAKAVTAGTFHSFVLRNVLRVPAAAPALTALGFKKGISIAILDAADSRKMLKDAFNSLGEHERRQCKALSLGVKQFSEQMTKARAHGLDQTGYLKLPMGDQEQRILHRFTFMVWERYATACRKQNAVDFDDILVVAMEVLRRTPQLGTALAQRFQYVQLDEYQDTNAVQMQIVDAFVKHHGNIAVVGDDRQSIYGFRGADVGIIQGFRKRYPSARIIDLNINYRSTPAILHTANGVAEAMPRRLSRTSMEAGARSTGPKPELHEYRNEHEEGAAIADMAAGLVEDGHPAQEVAVLYRDRTVKQSIEKAFISAGVPYVVVGDSGFFGKKEVRDLLALIRFAVQPENNVDGLRLLDAVKLGVSRKKLEVVFEATGRGVRLQMEALCTKGGKTGEKIGRLLMELDALSRRLNTATPDGAVPLGAVVHGAWTRLLQESLEKYVRSTDKDDDEDYGDGEEKITNKMRRRQENVEFLIKEIERRAMEGASIADIVDDLALLDVGEQAPNEEDEGAVQLMTIHASKGLEFRTVIVAGVENQIIPGRNDDGNGLEEERRIFYVALTRAMERLVVTFTNGRTIYGQWVPTSRSIFLVEVQDRFEHQYLVGTENGWTFKHLSG